MVMSASLPVVVARLLPVMVVLTWARLAVVGLDLLVLPSRLVALTAPTSTAPPVPARLTEAPPLPTLALAPWSALLVMLMAPLLLSCTLLTLVVTSPWRRLPAPAPPPATDTDTPPSPVLTPAATETATALACKAGAAPCWREAPRVRLPTLEPAARLLRLVARLLLRVLSARATPMVTLTLSELSPA